MEDQRALYFYVSPFEKVVLLDPTFRTPGWGADADYSHRVTEAGLELYVSHRAMVWHHRPAGGFSAEFIYGGKRAWLRKGLKQVKEDMEVKYGPNWRKVLPVNENEYDAEI